LQPNTAAQFTFGTFSSEVVCLEEGKFAQKRVAMTPRVRAEAAVTRLVASFSVI